VKEFSSIIHWLSKVVGSLDQIVFRKRSSLLSELDLLKSKDRSLPLQQDSLAKKEII
jgi:hypothetical protein